MVLSNEGYSECEISVKVDCSKTVVYTAVGICKSQIHLAKRGEVNIQGR